jgi:hypothetical protein
MTTPDKRTDRDRLVVALKKNLARASEPELVARLRRALALLQKRRATR